MFPSWISSWMPFPIKWYHGQYSSTMSSWWVFLWPVGSHPRAAIPTVMASRVPKPGQGQQTTYQKSEIFDWLEPEEAKCRVAYNMRRLLICKDGRELWGIRDSVISTSELEECQLVIITWLLSWWKLSIIILHLTRDRRRLSWWGYAQSWWGKLL